MRKRIDLSASDAHPLPRVGSPVTTACKGVILYETGTPTTLYHGKRIYFCLVSCLKAFLDDPETSCLADETKGHNS